MNLMEQCMESLHARICTEISKLRSDIVNLKELTRPVGSEESDEVSRMDSIMAKSVNDAVLSISQSRLAALEYALTRIKDEDYGYCVECGEKIPDSRLMAMPEAAYCIDCAEDLGH